MPEPRRDFSGVNIGKSFVVVGGGNGHFYSNGNAIYKITCSMKICKWIRLPQKLSTPRRGMVAIPIPDSLVNCE